MKVSELIAHLQEFHDMDEDIYCEYWTGEDILEYLDSMYNDCGTNTIPKECAQYVIAMLEKYGTSFDYNDLWCCVYEHYEDWRKLNDTQSA